MRIRPENGRDRHPDLLAVNGRSSVVGVTLVAGTELLLIASVGSDVGTQSRVKTTSHPAGARTYGDRCTRNATSVMLEPDPHRTGAPMTVLLDPIPMRIGEPRTPLLAQLPAGNGTPRRWVVLEPSCRIRDPRGSENPGQSCWNRGPWERRTQDSGHAGTCSSWNRRTHDQPAGTDSYVNRRTLDHGHDWSVRPAGPVPHGDEGTQEIRSVTVSPWNRLTVNIGSAGTGSSLHQRTLNHLAPSEDASPAGTDPTGQRTLGGHDRDSSANRMYLDQSQAQPESTEIVNVGTESRPQGPFPSEIEVAVDASPSGAGSPQNRCATDIPDGFPEGMSHSGTPRGSGGPGNPGPMDTDTDDRSSTNRTGECKPTSTYWDTAPGCQVNFSGPDMCTSKRHAAGITGHVSEQ